MGCIVAFPSSLTSIYTSITVNGGWAHLSLARSIAQKQNQNQNQNQKNTKMRRRKRIHAPTGTYLDTEGQARRRDLTIPTLVSPPFPIYSISLQNGGHCRARGSLPRKEALVDEPCFSCHARFFATPSFSGWEEPALKHTLVLSPQS
jgi:hypothetical protein